MHRWKAEICAVILPKFELKRSATSGKLRPYVFFFPERTPAIWVVPEVLQRKAQLQFGERFPRGQSQGFA